MDDPAAEVVVDEAELLFVAVASMTAVSEALEALLTLAALLALDAEDSLEALTELKELDAEAPVVEADDASELAELAPHDVAVVEDEGSDCGLPLTPRQAISSCSTRVNVKGWQSTGAVPPGKMTVMLLSRFAQKEASWLPVGKAGVIQVKTPPLKEKPVVTGPVPNSNRPTPFVISLTVA